MFALTLVVIASSANAQLVLIQTVTDGIGGVDGIAGVRHLELSPNGQQLYAAGNGDSAVAVFAIDPGSGALIFEQALKDDTVGGTSDGLQNARFLDVSADGENVYVASYNEFAASAFTRNLGDGTLTFLNEQAGPVAIGPFISLNEVALSPDGNHLYAVSNSYASVLTRGVGGSLTYVDSYSESLDSFGQGTALAISPDGQNVYIGHGNFLEVTARDAGGGLVHVTQYEDGDAGVDGLAQPETIAITADGLHLYVGTYFDSSVTHFTRDPADGTLTFQGAYMDQDVCPDANEIRLVESDATLLVSCLKTVAIYERNVTTGDLLSVVAITQEALGASEIYSAALNGTVLYLASEVTNSILVLPEPGGALATAFATLAALAITARRRAR
jgi:6-phosphogluconolactonase (cycloisomerase 2 family)